MQRLSMLALAGGLATMVATASLAFPSEDQVPADVAAAQAREILVSQQKIDEAARNGDFQAFKAATYREPFEGGGFIVDGDVFIPNEDALALFYLRGVLSAATTPRTEKSGAIAKFAIAWRYDGYEDVWDDSQRNAITYCVSTGFGAAYQNVVRAMTAAAGAWQQAAKVTFVHSASEDGNCTASNINVVFDVRPVNSGNQYLARAFFPSYRRSDRNVLIDVMALQLPVDSPRGTGLTGVLRHELGHTLGARHEHTRPEAGTCFEDAGWKPVTDYDAFSVMHYPQCNGKGDWTLRLTNMDRNGVACVYGAANGFVIDPRICSPKPFDSANRYAAF